MSAEMTIVRIDPTWRRKGGWGLDVFGGDSSRYLAGVFGVSRSVVELSLLNLGPGSKAADHSHPDPEALLCFNGEEGTEDGLSIAWLDEEGRFYEEPMNPGGETRLFVVGPNVPHAVMNKSSSNAFGIEVRSMPRRERQVTRQDVFAAMVSQVVR